MWIKEKFFKYSIGTLIVLVIIFLLGQIDFFIEPFKKFITILFFPVFISGLLYYLLRPLLRLVEKIRIPRRENLRIPRGIAIVLIYCVVIAFVAIVSSYAGSLIIRQVNQLVADMPGFIEASKAKTSEIINSQYLALIPLDKLEQQLTSFLGKAVPFLSQSIFSGISAVAGVATVLVLVPFILFYFLKDDSVFSALMLKLVPEAYRKHGEEILDDVDKTLSTYITGQAMIALVIGVLMYTGYTILGMKYALILALFAMFTAIIPILGAFIGVLPALLVGLAASPLMPVKILIVMIIVQQLEGNLISPQIMGKRMNIHPLTFIFILLVAASLYGFIGMLIAVPVYAVCKVIITNLIKIYRLRKV